MNIFKFKPPDRYDADEPGIVLRQFIEDDADFLLHIATDAPVARFVPWAKWVKDKDTALRQIEEFNSSYDSEIRVRYLVEREGIPIGYVGLWPDEHEDYYEFGFAVIPELRGQGLGRKILSSIRDLASQYLRARVVIARVHEENVSSKATVVSAGFSPTNSFDDGERRYELKF